MIGPNARAGTTDPARFLMGNENGALELLAPAGWLETWRPAALWVAMANTAETRRSYAVVVRQLAAIAPVPFGELGREHLIAYKFALVDSGRAPATIRQRLFALRALFGWAEAEGLYPGPNPATGIPMPKARRAPKARALSGAEVSRLLEAAGSLRDRALLALLADGGLRAAEVVALAEADIRTEGGRWIAFVQSGKGGRDRRVPITARARDLVAEYIGEGESRIAGPGRLLFQGSGPAGEGLSTRQVSRIVASSAEAAGLGTLRPHDLRRTFTTRALEAGAPIGKVSAALGHSSIRTTARYYFGTGSGSSVAEFLEGAADG